MGKLVSDEKFVSFWEIEQQKQKESERFGMPLKLKLTFDRVELLCSVSTGDVLLAPMIIQII